MMNSGLSLMKHAFSDTSLSITPTIIEKTINGDYKYFVGKKKREKQMNGIKGEPQNYVPY